MRKCETCKTNDVKKKGRMYCSRECQHKSIEKPIKYEINNKGCHICTSHYLNFKGYPMVSRNRKPYRMSRYIYEQENGGIPIGLQIRHTCDDRACINIEHLLIGTNADNMRDMVERGRSLKGERKLTKTTILLIRENKTSSHVKLSKIYGVMPETISNIRNGKTWKHVKIKEQRAK